MRFVCGKVGTFLSRFPIGRGVVAAGFLFAIFRRAICFSVSKAGAVAQLVERVVRNDEVIGSIPIGSTSLK